MIWKPSVLIPQIPGFPRFRELLLEPRTASQVALPFAAQTA